MSHECEERIISYKINRVILIYNFKFWNNGKCYSFRTYSFKRFSEKQLEAIDTEIINQVIKIKEEFNYDSSKDKGTLCFFDDIILNKIQTFLTKQYGFVVLAQGTCGYSN